MTVTRLLSATTRPRIMRVLGSTGMLLAVTILVRPAAATLRTGTARLPEDVMPLARIRPGMQGYGLTVFKGVKIERFGVTVVAVVRNGSLVVPGHDMILVRLNGGPITERGAYLIRGMSGSPVYINGKCIGAFSQGEPTAKEPLGGVTPIEDMLEAWDPGLPQSDQVSDEPRRADIRRSQALRARTVALNSPIRLGKRVIRRIAFDSTNSRDSADPATLRLRPCTSMMTVSGLNARARRRLSAMLEPYGVEVVQAATGQANQPIRGATLQPGAAMAVMLLSGDITSGSTGTVTYRRGDRLLAFGHPFLGLGPLPAPICTAYVHDVYALTSSSYKITSPGPPVGSVLQDRPFSVAARVGPAPEMIPVTIDIDDRTTGRKRTYSMRAVAHPNLYPGLIGLAAGSAIADLHPTPSEITAQITTSVEAEDIGPIERRNTVYDRTAIDAAATADLEEILGALANNPFRRTLVRRVRLHAILEPGRKTAAIELASVPKTTIRSGDPLEVSVTLAPYGGGPSRTVRLNVPIPADAPAGRATLVISGGAPPPIISIAGIVIRPAAPTSPNRAPPATVRQMIDRILERETGNEITVELTLPNASVAFRGAPIKGVPEYRTRSLKQNRSSGWDLDAIRCRAVQQTDWVVSGRRTISVEILGDSPSTRKNGDKAPLPAPATERARVASATERSDALIHGALGVQRRTGEARKPSAPAQNVAPKSASTTPPSGPAAPAPKPAASGSVARTARHWRFNAAVDWNKGERHGLAPITDGALVLAPEFTSVAELPPGPVWCLTSDGVGGVFAGIGTEGSIVHATADGTSSVVCRLPEVTVNALLRTSDGALYAATSPNGRTYRIAAGMPPEAIHDADEPGALALAEEGPDSILIGTGGGGGSVYRVTPSSTTALARDLDSDVTAILILNGSIYLGTGGHGRIVRVQSDGSMAPLMEQGGQTISGLERWKDDHLLASTAPAGRLYAIGADGSVVEVKPEAGKAVSSMDRSDSGSVLIAGEGLAERRDESGRITALDVPDDFEPMTIVAGVDGSLWIGAANSGRILRSRGVPMKGSFVSKPLDAGNVALWGQASWRGTRQAQTIVELLFRSGNTADPDASWSGWTRLQPGVTSGTITCPPARYLQFRAEMTAPRSDIRPELHEVVIAYLPANSPPSLTLRTPGVGDTWSGVRTLQWQATDPDGDTLEYTVERSSDDGAHWTTVPASAWISGSSAAPGAPADTAPAPPTTNPTQRRPLTVAQVTEELDRHPNVPAALREAIIERARAVNAEYERSRPDDKPAGDSRLLSSRATERQLDTSKLPDGVYRFRIHASDAPSNAERHQTTSQTSPRVVICNAAPVVYILRNTLSVNAAGELEIEVAAVQTLTTITGAQWRIDGGEWRAAYPVDGLADSTLERFRVKATGLTKGKRSLEIQVHNGAGLAASDTISVDVP